MSLGQYRLQLTAPNLADDLLNADAINKDLIVFN